MSQFSYYVVPTLTIPSFYYLNLPSFYYLNLPSLLPADPPPPETTTNIPSEQDILTAKPKPMKSTLELSQDELLAAGYQKKKQIWSSKEDEELLQLIGEKGVPWKQIHLHMQGRTQKMCYSRYRRLMAEARQRWAPEEEQKLRDLVQQQGEQWKDFVNYFTNRTWKQIRDKYVNYLRPGINKDEWSLAQDMQILDLLKKHGTKWKSIQQEMGNRTDNQIKNRYYGRLKVLLKRKARKRA